MWLYVVLNQYKVTQNKKAMWKIEHMLRKFWCVVFFWGWIQKNKTLRMCVKWALREVEDTSVLGLSAAMHATRRAWNSVAMSFANLTKR